MERRLSSSKFSLFHANLFNQLLALNLSYIHNCLLTKAGEYIGTMHGARVSRLHALGISSSILCFLKTLPLAYRDNYCILTMYANSFKQSPALNLSLAKGTMRQGLGVGCCKSCRSDFFAYLHP